MVVEEVKATEKNKSGELLKQWIRKNAKGKIIEIFKHFEEALIKEEGDPVKLA